ncbi:ABC transporter permease [Paraconexibacter antarcticus]|uniref:Transport permease protein n=1 Tax=Paraconexibacter antarcticus TaxID=2949664 RepID=A0ABY5DST8_9ACTN|nr:ABC transporter permease [Paraconexibacter antarcticus]UTI65078.1 ABC transporter permease [Paraconexibacter antarcticus]
MTDVVVNTTAAIPVAHAPTRAAEARRLLTLTWTLALSDWKFRFYGSVLGLAWTLVRPFALFGVVYFVFTQIAGLDKRVPHYGVYILTALVMFNFFAETTNGCVQALVTRESLLRKMQFNPIVIPLSISVTALLNLGMTLIAVFIFAIGSGVYPTWTWLELPLLVALLFVLATGVGMMLSVLYVRFRDIQPIWEVVTQILFYASAILYVPTTVAESAASYYRMFLCNPIPAIFTQMRRAIIDPHAPSITHAFETPAYALIPLGIIIGIFSLGLWFFQRESPRVAENL